jgi:hypothetical protein
MFQFSTTHWCERRIGAASGQRVQKFGPLMAISQSLRELFSCTEFWLAQCLRKSNESLPNRNLVKTAKAE